MASLLDFGISIPEKPAAPDKVVPEPVKTFIHNQEKIDSDAKYTTNYIVECLSRKGSYAFDPRGWPNGINRKEFDRLWDNDFVVDQEGFFWNDGHFSLAVRVARKHLRADKELIWKAIEQVREQQIRYHMQSWKESFIQHCKYTCNAKSPKDRDNEIKWATYAWKWYNACRKEIGFNPEEMPEIFKLDYMNPLNWGVEVRSRNATTED